MAEAGITLLVHIFVDGKEILSVPIEFPSEGLTVETVCEEARIRSEKACKQQKLSSQGLSDAGFRCQRLDKRFEPPVFVDVFSQQILCQDLDELRVYFQRQHNSTELVCQTE